MAANSHPHDALRAIATDLLAQIEAQHRAALRVEQATRVLSAGATPVPPLQRLRDQLQRMRELFESQQTLLEEFERALATVNG